MKGDLTARVIECPGRWEDAVFEALQIDIEGFKSPFVMTMALPKVSCHALAQQVDPHDVYHLIATAINEAGFTVRVTA